MINKYFKNKLEKGCTKSKVSVSLIYQKQKAMTTITYKNRNYTVIEMTIIAERWPAIAAEYPNAEFHFIVEGKNGALKDGFVTKDNQVVFF